MFQTPNNEFTQENVKNRKEYNRQADAVNENLKEVAQERIGNQPPVYVEKANDVINMLSYGLEGTPFANLPHNAVLRMADDEADEWVKKAEAYLTDPETVKKLKKTQNFDYSKFQ